ncbi:unnamed protein product [Caretta caretta]
METELLSHPTEVTPDCSDVITRVELRPERSGYVSVCEAGTEHAPYVGRVGRARARGHPGVAVEPRRSGLASGAWQDLARSSRLARGRFPPQPLASAFQDTATPKGMEKGS